MVTGANRHDMKKLAALLDATVVEPAPTAPPHLALDRGYDYDACRDAAVARGYTPHIPPKASAARAAAAAGPPRPPPAAALGGGGRRTAGSTASGGC